MSVNGVTTNSYDSVNYQKTSSKKNTDATTATAATATTAATDEAAVYEKSSSSSPKTTYKANTELISKLKADADQRTSQLRSLVENLMTNQGKKFNEANMFTMLREGNFTVDTETSNAAKEAISENGEYGVKQTSERILSFAKALTGGDPSKIEEMRNAVEKGFSQAKKTWGGDLPEISQKTYEAVMKGFDDWANESKVEK